MTPGSIPEAFTLFRYHRDDRHPPDERRRGQFRAGWEDATKRGQFYSNDTLKRLTWHNLGDRLGRDFGDQTLGQINAAFDVLAGLYESPPSDGAAVEAAPSSGQYLAAFRKVGNVSDSQIQMLRLHYHAPARTITATQLAQAVGHAH